MKYLFVIKNNYLRSELNKLTEELMMKDKLIAQMNIEFSEKEAQYNIRNNDTEKKIEYIARENQYFLEKIDKLEAEVGEMVKFNNSESQRLLWNCS
jgi:hypothetical protein